MNRMRRLSVILAICLMFSNVNAFADLSGQVNNAEEQVEELVEEATYYKGDQIIKDLDDYFTELHKYVKDLNQLVMQIEDIHPRIKEMGYSEYEKSVIDSVYKKVDFNLTADQFHMMVINVLCSLHDSNTYTYYEFNDTSQVNLPFKWFNDGIYLLEDTNQLRKGDKIVSIGGKSVSELEELLQHVVPADNIYRLREKAPEILIWFQVLDYLGLVNERSFLTVEYIRDDKLKKIDLPRAYKVKTPSLDRLENGEWFIDEHKNIGYINLEKATYQYQAKELRMKLEELLVKASDKDVEKVVIDLRYVKEDTSLFIPDFVKLFMEEGEEWYFEGKKHRIRKYQYDITYKGEIVLLVGPGSGPIATKFADAVQANELGVVVGEPTGYRPDHYYSNRLMQYAVRLMESHIGCKVSDKQMVRPTQELRSSTYIKPDIIVESSLEDYLNKEDTTLSRLAQELKVTYEYQKRMITLDGMEKGFYLKDFFSEDEYDIETKVWFENFHTRMKHKCTLDGQGITTKVIFDPSMELSDEHYLILEKESGVRKATLTRFELTLPDNPGIINVSYVSKFQYVLLYAEPNLVKAMNSDLITIKDAKGDVISHHVFESIDPSLRPFTGVVSKSLSTGVYSITFDKGAIIYFNGLTNPEPLTISFTVN